MTDEQVNSYINKVTYSDEILDLFEQETNLENEFSSKFNIGDEGYKINNKLPALGHIFLFEL